MNMSSILFYLFSFILLLAAFRVITAPNPVHAALYLVLSFFSAAALWILLSAEFLALVLILVYVGAVMVLFLFVVMMFNLGAPISRAHIRRNAVVAIPVGILVAVEMIAVLVRYLHVQAAPASVDIGRMAELGRLLYTEYLYAVEIAAAILLVAMVAVVALTARPRQGGAQYTPADEAVRVDSRTRIRLVDLRRSPGGQKGEEP
ncbi:MAG: NADH-quinone oxidoreductase subunit J [Burkholderiaceae bacterium]|jgi:NADH-quinone oxidoreductase subunit J|nr:NADH-quinone oxidoreductase subunit J [Burkholderiaceae bacterium]